MTLHSLKDNYLEIHLNYIIILYFYYYLLMGIVITIIKEVCTNVWQNILTILIYGTVELQPVDIIIGDVL